MVKQWQGQKVIIMGLCLILIGVDLVTGKSYLEVGTIVWAILATQAYSKYKGTRKKIELVETISATVACLGCFVLYLGDIFV